MEATQSKRTIYLIIISSILWLFFVVYWMFSAPNDIATRDNQDEIITETNNIINTTDELPIACSQILTLLNCMISSPQLSGDKEWINQYYQKLISERNIMTDTALLEWECTKQYNYIQWLQESWYQQIIQSCNK
jgi:hypothetical protein